MAEVRVAEGEALGMVTLRADLADGAVGAAVEALCGVAVPGRLRLEGGVGRGAAWMAPDELLLFVPRGQGAEAAAGRGGDLAGAHHLALDVSDLRAHLRLRGPFAREVLAKVSPVDCSPEGLPDGMVRRTRVGQVAAALWVEGEEARVLCFRSVAAYALGLLRRSAADGPVGAL